MKKRILCFAAAAVLALGMAGCGSQSGTSASSSAASAAASLAASSASSAASSAAVSSAASSAASADASSAESVSSSGGTFTVGFDADFPPMGFKADDGSYTGFDLELAKEAASRMGLTFKAQPIAWDAKDAELSAGTIDCIWNGFTINGRENDYTWSEPYLNNSQVFVVRSDSGITDSKGLAGKIVEVQTDSSAEAALSEKTELSSTFTVQSVADYNTAFMDLQSGSVDAVAMDIIVAGYQIQNRSDGSDFKILDESISDEQYGVGFLKGNTELRDKVEKVLEEMAADGTMAKVSEKWFGKDITILGK
ncbi:MAG: amino acid ABC transporter substrate-binding protein [Lachnospiraceae bacterium]|nr:amino acid ABC transporter substrate-binding protein [Lachnospiraceae bacterium]